MRASIFWILAVAVGWGVPISGLLAEHGPEWEALQAVAAKACQSHSEVVTLEFEPSKRIIKVIRELKLSEVSTRRTVQTVSIDFLTKEIPIEGIGGLADPWLKIRTMDGQKRVFVEKVRSVGGEKLEDEKEEPPREFLIIPCQTRDIKRLRDALQAFLQAK
jgi:hypothetical protein